MTYPGMLKRRIKGTDICIQVYGWGEESEIALEEAYAKKLEAMATEYDD